MTVATDDNVQIPWRAGNARLVNSYCWDLVLCCL